MGYQEKLKIGGEYSGIFPKHIVEYFTSMEFYEDTMHPRFMNGDDYDKLTLNAPVLRHDADDDEGNTIRVFMNSTEIYIEVQTPWRGYRNSLYKKFDSPPSSINELEEVLNEITRNL